MNTLSTVRLTALLLAPLAALHAAEAPKPQARPNIIVILADDLGYECIGANGGKSYRTPHLDRLAREGVRFEHCYGGEIDTPNIDRLAQGGLRVSSYYS